MLFKKSSAVGRKLSLIILILAGLILTSACRQPEHFIKDKSYRLLVQESFRKRAEIASGRNEQLFSVFKRPLRPEEKEALEFLYAFMPLSDLANLDGEYFLEQVRAALEARRYFSWGKKIPDSIFRHFVLPYRVNNENPDGARRVFFEELKDRIKHLDMYQAALEVNHWCHEKVTYRSTDERTSAPLATVRTAFGRCGEESTFTVAALRAVSLPARQVYTPRWAHTDDNHAWVEVWVDGRWHYLGACEPEPELDQGWFTGPASRAMLVHTTVYGQYHGPEEIILKTDLFTRINQLPRYAPVTLLTVEVKDSRNRSVAEARVDFCLYNYAEFFPIASKTTDQNGRVSLLTGYGDLVIQASKDNLYTWTKVSAGRPDRISLVLTEPDFTERKLALDLVPPAAREVEPGDPIKAEENNRRLRQEDCIRQQYETSFINREIAAIFCREKNLPFETVWKYLETSRGNWPEIIDYLSALTPGEQKLGLALLGAITQKDLRDTPSSVLLHHLRETLPPENGLDEEIYIRYVLSPRIGRELLTPWRKFIKEKFSPQEKTRFKENPENIGLWIKQNIKIDETNYYQVPLFPQGALELQRADLYSRKILFVAMARTLGQPARLDRVTERAQYFHSGQWHEVCFEDEESLAESKPKTRLKITYQPIETVSKAIYYTHFTLARFKNGRYQTLDLENEPALNSASLELMVDPGHYLLISGNRQPDGSALVSLHFFRVPETGFKEICFSLRTEPQEPAVLGKFEPEATVYDFKDKSSLNLNSWLKGQSFIMALIDPDREPSKHLMTEIQALADRFVSWPGNLLVVIAWGKIPAGLSPEIYSDLPDSARLVYDEKNQLPSLLKKALSREPTSLPAVIAVRSSREIMYYSEGYQIGTGEQLLKRLPWLK